VVGFFSAGSGAFHLEEYSGPFLPGGNFGSSIQANSGDGAVVMYFDTSYSGPTSIENRPAGIATLICTSY